MLSDGGTIQLCWWISGDATIALLPGLNNDSRLPMIQHVAHNLRKHGFTVVGFAKPYLTEEADVEQYVDAMKKTLLEQIRAGKKVIV